MTNNIPHTCPFAGATRSFRVSCDGADETQLEFPTYTAEANQELGCGGFGFDRESGPVDVDDGRITIAIGDDLPAFASDVAAD